MAMADISDSKAPMPHLSFCWSTLTRQWSKRLRSVLQSFYFDTIASPLVVCSTIFPNGPNFINAAMNQEIDVYAEVL